MATCGCSKEVFRQSYELLCQDLSIAYKDQGWTDSDIRRKAARQFRDRYKLDVYSYIRESTEKGAYYTAEFEINDSRVFFPSYNISLEALHDNQRRKTPDQYSLSDHQTSRMIEEAFRRGATIVVTSYAREGKDNRDVVVMTYDHETRRGKQMIINAAPDGLFHSFEGIQAIAQRQFGHLNKVFPSDRVFILTDATISLPDAQSVLQQVVQETKANQCAPASFCESSTTTTTNNNNDTLRRKSKGGSNELKTAYEDSKQSFSARQAEEKDEQSRKGIPLSRREIPLEINERKTISDDKEEQSGTDKNDSDQGRVGTSRSDESRRYIKSSGEVKASPSTAIEKKDRPIIEVSIGIRDKKEDVLPDSSQQYPFQDKLFETNKQVDVDRAERVLKKQEMGDFLEISGVDPFVVIIQDEMPRMEYRVINPKNRENVDEEDARGLDEAIFAFRERKGALKEQSIIIIDEKDQNQLGATEGENNQEIQSSNIEEQASVLWFMYQVFLRYVGDCDLVNDQSFLLLQERQSLYELATDEHDVDMIDDHDLLLKEFFIWIHEQLSMVSKLLYDEYEVFEDDENKKSDKRINIPVVMCFLVLIQRIANRSVDFSSFNSISYSFDFSREGVDEKGQGDAVSLTKHLNTRKENAQMSFFNQQEENFIVWQNVNSEGELVLRMFHVLCMFLTANRAFPYPSEQIEEYRCSVWILLSVIRYMTMMKEGAIGSYYGLQQYAYSSKKTRNFPQSGIIFMISLDYDRSPANQPITA